MLFWNSNFVTCFSLEKIFSKMAKQQRIPYGETPRTAKSCSFLLSWGCTIPEPTKVLALLAG
jgi:hypothetical protein